MNPIYVLLFRVDTGRFVGAHFARNTDEATGFARGVLVATKKRRVYVWPRDRQRINAAESTAETARSNKAIQRDIAARAADKPGTKSTIDFSCDECPAKPGEFCLRVSNGKWIRRADGFHASRLAKARGL